MPSDVFSFGALTWHLATGQLPHEDINPFAVMLAVSRGELELDWPASVPKPLRKLGRMCMQHDPAARPTFPDIVRALMHYEDRMRQCAAAASVSSVYGTPAGCGGGAFSQPAAGKSAAAVAMQLGGGVGAMRAWMARTGSGQRRDGCS